MKRKNFDKIEKTEVGAFFEYDKNADYDKKSIKALDFEEYEDGWVVSRNKKTDKIVDLTIPAIYKGKPVVRVSYQAFCSCDNLKSVRIPSTVKSIGNSAFIGCDVLETVVLPFVGSGNPVGAENYFGYIFGANSYYKNNEFVPKSLKNVVITGGESIGNHAFSGCNKISSVIVCDGVTSISSDAFYKCEDLSKIILPNTLLGIGSRAFSGCAKLREIVIPNSVISIGSLAFEKCTSLTSAIIPFNVEKIGWGAFSECKDLSYVEFMDGNDWYSSTSIKGKPREKIPAENLRNTAIASSHLKDSHCFNYWFKIIDDGIAKVDQTEED